MADFILKNGREIVFDWDAVTLAEYRLLASVTNPPSKDVSDPLFAQVCGLTVDELEQVGYREFTRLRSAFWKSASGPLSDPN